MTKSNCWLNAKIPVYHLSGVTQSSRAMSTDSSESKTTVRSKNWRTVRKEAFKEKFNIEFSPENLIIIPLKFEGEDPPTFYYNKNTQIVYQWTHKTGWSLTDYSVFDFWGMMRSV
jgi:hypothetical protein